MRKVTLLYNPLSGQRREERLADMRAVVAVLREAGLHVTAAPTQAAADASEQARHAVAGGSDTVFACGGDGTVHDVIQGLVGTEAALGIIPMGTANALAHDLGLPLSPVAAARAALTAQPRRIAVGKITFQDFQDGQASRYFGVTAGVGVDAYLFHELDSAAKLRLGIMAYYLHAAWLWLTHRMRRFTVQFQGERGEVCCMQVTELLAVRIRNFGGVLRVLAPGASLDRPDLRLVLFRTRSRFRYLLYVLRGLLGLPWRTGGVKLAYSRGAECRVLAPRPGKRAVPIYVEADGEFLGKLPAEISVVPDALTILSPSQR
ncbi:MAG TPA: diacylglycerol kinase family protein [Terriglobales bacterium]|nr:diacylglycerol kinase family protein [Terriglobales bacterium]